MRMRRPSNLLRRWWWKVSPPPVMSHYLYSPFKENLVRVLSDEVRKKAPLIEIEFGCLYGYTTIIISKNLPPRGRLTSHDIFESVPKETGRKTLIAPGFPM
jgi:hypothetical protein